MTTTISEPRTASTSQEILTLSEAAAYLRVAEDVLLRIAEEGTVPARKVGQEWRFLKPALQAWLYREGGPEGRRVRWVPLVPEIDLEAFFEELERRLLAKLPARDTVPAKPTPEEIKQRILAAAGIWKDDPTVDEMLREIYRQRGRPMTEEGE